MNYKVITLLLTDLFYTVEGYILLYMGAKTDLGPYRNHGSHKTFQLLPKSTSENNDIKPYTEPT
jgi:hypothetical protein